jgi:hypothetical protein
MDWGKNEAKEFKEFKEFEEFEETLSRSVPRCGLTVHLSNLYLRKSAACRAIAKRRRIHLRLKCLSSAVFLCFLRLFAAIPVFVFHLCVFAALRENQSRG